MEFRREGTALEGRALVFLDTADWSYMEEGRAAETNELRALCEAGRANIIVTLDHLLEAVGLKSGRNSRLAFMRAFPGAVLVPLSGTQLMKTSARGLALHALDQPMLPWQVQCHELQALTDDELREHVRWLRFLWWADTFYARMLVRSREVDRHPTKTEREKFRRLLRLAREKGVDEVAEQLRRMAEERRVPAVVQRLSARAIVALHRWGNRGGMLAGTGDFVFDAHVSSALPPQVVSNKELMRAVWRAWSDKEQLIAVAPALACAVEIARQSSNSRDLQKIRSTETDKRHAAFAPLVDVYTCDGRIAPILTRLLAGRRRAPRIVRTKCLGSVVTAIRDRDAMPAASRESG